MPTMLSGTWSRGEAFEAPAQEQLVARALGLELEADAVGLQVEVAGCRT